MIKTSKKYLLFMLLIIAPQLALAQMDSDYFKAEQLFHQQKFEQAYQIFEQLHHENPTSYLFLDKATECLVNLKKYEKAAALVKEAISNGHFQLQGVIRLGEIYHISGDEKRAFSVWNEVLKKHSGNYEVALRVARVMKDRGAYKQSIEVYKKAAEALPNSTMITSELAETYLEAGIYDKAIQQFLQLVKQEPSRINFVQTRLIRLQNDAIYNTAIAELSDFLDDLSPDHPSYGHLRRLEIWLLMEQKSFKQALKKAEVLEAKSPSVTYALYNLGTKLLAEQEFELAEEAFSFYIENGSGSIKNRSREELARVYIKWAEYYEDHSLGLSPEINQLYQKAFSTLQQLYGQTSGYYRMDKVLIMLSELSLDVLHQPEKAAEYLAELRGRSGSSSAAAASFIQGRIHLYNKNFSRARVSFTESSKQSESQGLSAKSRYYLALTDFYAGDYEFAQIQLKALERENSSYFANNALQLGLWIQNGLRADSTAKSLEPFARAVEHFSQGENQQGIEKLKHLFNDHNYHPLMDDALLELSAHKSMQNVIFIYDKLSQYLRTYGMMSPLHERLLWEKARIADQLVTNKKIPADVLTKSSNDSLKSSVELPTDIDQIITLYEEMLLKFPNGFYATYARNRIQELQKMNT
ncbi:MAG TPA: tetratricopeptide repeat protein [Balneolaceae bacterium]|nr:tetratricopeptide repeat protein [Balneolaceae bacterium]